MTTVTIHQAKTHLSKLLAEVKKGVEVLILKGSEPVARLVPYHEGEKKRPPVGTITSRPVRYADDCFKPMTQKEMEDMGLV